MATLGRPVLPTMRSSNFCKPLTKPRPISRNGIARRSSATRLRIQCCIGPRAAKLETSPRLVALRPFRSLVVNLQHNRLREVAVNNADEVPQPGGDQQRDNRGAELAAPRSK